MNYISLMLPLHVYLNQGRRKELYHALMSIMLHRSMVSVLETDILLSLSFGFAFL